MDPVFDAPLASPELALVDPELAADLRRTHRPEHRWLPRPARMEAASAEEEATPPRLDSRVDAGHAGSGTAGQVHDNESIEPEEAAFADSPSPPLTHVDEASLESADDASAALSAVADVLREAEALAEQVVADEYIAATPDEQQTRSHYPVLPAPEPDVEATDATDVALLRIRESLTEADEAPSPKRRIRRGFTLGSGVVAAFAVAAMGADVQLQLAQLPSWLQF